jgi:hypothetical protein
MIRDDSTIWIKGAPGAGMRVLAEKIEHYLIKGPLDMEGVKLATKHRQRHAGIRPPDGLHTASEAAAKLRCSIKTLNGHIDSGALGYVIIGHGTKRPRRMFTDAALDAFIANQTRKDVPSCPSTRTRVRHSGNSTSGGEVIAFTAQPKPRPDAKPKK